MKKYRIFLKETEDLSAGWLDDSLRINSYIYGREENKKDASAYYDFYQAWLAATDCKRLGYPCKIVPKLTKKQKKYILKTG